MDSYGRTVVQERVNPRYLAEVARYVRVEYGPGMGLGYFLAQVANAAAPPRKKGMRQVHRLVRALANALRAVVPGNGNGRKAKAPSTRVSE